MEFEKLTPDDFIDTGALTSTISEQDLNKMKLFAPEAIQTLDQHQTSKHW